MDKLSGGLLLECGHRQVVTTYRAVLAEKGQDQHAIFCVECDDWRFLTRKQNSTEE